jgi:hypothetical protein
MRHDPLLSYRISPLRLCGNVAVYGAAMKSTARAHSSSLRSAFGRLVDNWTGGGFPPFAAARLFFEVMG